MESRTNCQKIFDETLMEWGKHRCKPYKLVPAKYFLWLYEKNVKDDTIRSYVEDNIDILKKEVKVGKNLRCS